MHVHLQEKRKAPWPLPRQCYPVHLPLYVTRWRQARRVETIAGLQFPPIGRMTQRHPFGRSSAWAMSLSTYLSGSDQSYRRTAAVLDLRFAPGYRMFRACLGLFEGAAAR